MQFPIFCRFFVFKEQMFSWALDKKAVILLYKKWRKVKQSFFFYLVAQRQNLQQLKLFEFWRMVIQKYIDIGSFTFHQNLNLIPGNGEMRRKRCTNPWSRRWYRQNSQYNMHGFVAILLFQIHNFECVLSSLVQGE